MPRPPAGTGQGTFQQMLFRNVWGVKSIMETTLDVDIPGVELPSIKFLPGGQISGSTGCNSFQGTYRMEGSKISLDPGSMTKKFCEGSQEVKFLHAIRKTTDVRPSGEGIALLSESGQILMMLKPKQ